MAIESVSSYRAMTSLLIVFVIDPRGSMPLASRASVQAHAPGLAYGHLGLRRSNAEHVSENLISMDTDQPLLLCVQTSALATPPKHAPGLLRMGIGPDAFPCGGGIRAAAGWTEPC